MALVALHVSRVGFQCLRCRNDLLAEVSSILYGVHGACDVLHNLGIQSGT
jgi:hypothetical protein